MYCLRSALQHESLSTCCGLAYQVRLIAASWILCLLWSGFSAYWSLRSSTATAARFAVHTFRTNYGIICWCLSRRTSGCGSVKIYSASQWHSLRTFAVALNLRRFASSCLWARSLNHPQRTFPHLLTVMQTKQQNWLIRTSAMILTFVGVFPYFLLHVGVGKS